MAKVHDFVAGLARTRKSAAKIKSLTDAVFRDRSLTKTTIYNILKKVKTSQDTADQRHLNVKKTNWTLKLV
jgi:hypothetical protein